MKFKEKYLRVSAFTVSVAALLFFAFQQYTFYQTDVIFTREQLRVNTLRGQLPGLDESLTMSARLYVLTGEPRWKERYNRRLKRYDSVYAAIGMLLPENFSGKRELEAAADSMIRLEARGLELADVHRQEEAQVLLFGAAYDRYRRMYKAGLEKLDAELDTKVEQLMAAHRSEALKNSGVIGTVILLILLGGHLFSRLTRKWQNQLVESNRLRAEEAMAAEKVLQKANSQLRLLFLHLQEVREEERLAIAHDINEDLGQQLTAVKLKMELMGQYLPAGAVFLQKELSEASAQLGAAIIFLQEVATEVYPLVLRDLGLEEALHWESNRVADQSGIAVFFSCEAENLALDQQKAAALFQIYREKLKSVVLNGASQIICSLRQEENHLLFTIYDDATATACRPPIEEVAIKERLRSIQGTLQISCSPEEGNGCMISIPLEKLRKVGFNAGVY